VAKVKNILRSKGDLLQNLDEMWMGWFAD